MDWHLHLLGPEMIHSSTLSLGCFRAKTEKRTDLFILLHNLFSLLQISQFWVDLFSVSFTRTALFFWKEIYYHCDTSVFQASSFAKHSPLLKNLGTVSLLDILCIFLLPSSHSFFTLFARLLRGSEREASRWVLRRREIRLTRPSESDSSDESPLITRWWGRGEETTDDTVVFRLSEGWNVGNAGEEGMRGDRGGGGGESQRDVRGEEEEAVEEEHEECNIWDSDC